eukprot:9384774-Alexandrium_andersonii.AAC.1
MASESMPNDERGMMDEDRTCNHRSLHRYNQLLHERYYTRLAPVCTVLRPLKEYCSANGMAM